jgi:hypothetical protein
MAAGRRVRVRPAPVLHQEQGETVGGRAEVLLRVERPQHRIGRHPLVEHVDEPAERRLAADGHEEAGLLGLLLLACRDDRQLTRCTHPSILPANPLTGALL